MTLHLDKRYYPQGDLVIEARRQQPGDYLIDHMTLGGKKLSRYRISHSDLLRGGHLIYYVR